MRLTTGRALPAARRIPSVQTEAPSAGRSDSWLGFWAGVAVALSILALILNGVMAYQAFQLQQTLSILKSSVNRSAPAWVESGEPDVARPTPAHTAQ